MQAISAWKLTLRLRHAVHRYLAMIYSCLTMVSLFRNNIAAESEAESSLLQVTLVDMNVFLTAVYSCYRANGNKLFRLPLLKIPNQYINYSPCCRVVDG